MDESTNLKENFLEKNSPRDNKEREEFTNITMSETLRKKNMLHFMPNSLLTPNPLLQFLEGLDYFQIKSSTFNLIKSSIPSILSIMFVFLYDNLNIIFANKFLSRESGSAVGIGSLYINATGFYLGLGLLGGVDTLCSQAYGAKSFYLMGLYVNISRIVLIGFFIFVCLPFIIYSETILFLINQPVEIIPLTSRYVKSMIPSVFFALQFYVSEHYLQAMNIFNPGMLVTFITASLHSLWLYIFLGVLKCDIGGIGYAMGATHLLNYLIISVYIDNYKPNPESYFFWDKNSISLIRIYDYLKMAVPSAIMFCADWLGFHVLILYSSYIDLTSLNANVALFNFVTLILSIPTGISIATTVLVGNNIGRNQINLAKLYSVISCVLSITLVLVLNLVLQFFKIGFPYLYTNDPQVAHIFSKLMSFFVLFGIFDSLQLSLNGILIGLGKQKPASLITLIILYPINIPMTITLAFSMNYGTIGLWYAQLSAVIFLDFSYMIMILCLDWESNAQRTIVKISIFAEKFLRKTQRIEMEQLGYEKLNKGENYMIHADKGKVC
jgi:multidrug resistance protein, MATE family